MHDQEEQLKLLQECPPSPNAKQAHMARYLRDNAYYTLRDMDLTTFSRLYPFEPQHPLLCPDILNDEMSLGGLVDKEEPLRGWKSRRTRWRPSENSVALHQMTARLCLLRRKGRNKDRAKDNADGSRTTTAGIFARQKQGIINEENENKGNVIGEIENQVDPEKSTERNPKEEQGVVDAFDIETVSVDSIDNVLYSGTSELDYHRQKRSSQSYDGLLELFHM
jgi:hypothetical protein